MSGYAFDTPVPFSPIPTDQREMALVPAWESTSGNAIMHTKSPAVAAYDEACRRAVFAIHFGQDDEAKEQGELAVQLDFAYRLRSAAEWRAEREQEEVAAR